MRVKICGIVHPDDAEEAARLGADYIGIIFADRSKRKVLPAMAKGIVEVSRRNGADPVGVFVDQTADQIIAICEQTGIDTVQLHGEISRKALPILLEKYSIIYAVAIETSEGTYQMPMLPTTVMPLFDHSIAGSGQHFNWAAFTPPQKRKWILAGGLNPTNVREAIALLNPSGVDVATGVEIPNTVRKDPILLKAFIRAAKEYR